MKNKEDILSIDGIIKETLSNAMFRIEIVGRHKILRHIYGKMCMNYI